MRKLLLVAISILCVGPLLAAPAVWTSSNTATADTTKSLCGSSKGIFHGVCINDTPTMTGTVAIYNSRGSATSPVAVIRSTAAVSNCKYYDVSMSSGITYTNSTASNITLLYSCY